MQIFMSHELMVLSGMVFGEVISAIQFGFAPIHVILALSDAIADPIEAHIDGFGPLLFDGVIGEASGGGVVGFDGSGWLYVP